MRGVRLLFVFTVMLVLSAGISYAAFDNSHHDMRAYNSKTEACLQCHGLSTTSSSAAFDNQIGTVGGLCLARCHIGGAGLPAGAANAQLTPTAGPSVNTADYSITNGTANINIVYFDASHGRNPGNLVNPAFAAAAAAVAWPPSGGAANTWPYVVSGQNIQCTSCHAVHDNQNGPFLWSALAPAAANGTDGFCDKCHSETGRRGSMGAAPAGNHPVNMLVNQSNAAGRGSKTTGDANGRRPRRISIQQYSATRVFDVTNQAPNTLINTTADASSWHSGGHVISVGTSAVQNTTAIAAWDCATSTQVAGCFTCHAAHRTNQNNENNLVNVATLSPTTVTWNPLCVGCHGAQTTRANDAMEFDAGMTGFGHPVGDCTAGTLTGPYNYTTSVGQFTFSVAQFPFNGSIFAQYPQNGNQYGAQGRVLCTSCHKVHGGQNMALANLGQNTTYAAGGICKRCHNGTGIINQNDYSKGGTGVTTGSNAANSHHVTRSTGLSYGAGVQQTNEGAVGTLYIKQPSWAVSGGAGDLTLNMDCADCHTFNKTAHNW